MNEKYSKQKYFNWLCDQIEYRKMTHNNKYTKLLRYLFNKNFTYIIPLDENRYYDGLDLRQKQFDGDIDILGDCSILEMLVALSIRCEDYIMCDDDIGDQTGKWFWLMIFNLNLRSMTDEYFDKIYVDDVIYKFLNRKYDPDGTGGLFRIKNCPHDLREVEIWYQLNWYLDTII